MVSLSFRSLETFIRDENLPGLRSYLSSRSVVIDDRDDNGNTALILAAQRGLSDFCTELLQHGADIHAEDNDQWCALVTAAKEGHCAVVATLLDHGANVHHKDMGGWTALMWASYRGHTDLVRLLLDHGADPNTQGPHHMTSLMWAAGRGHTEVAKDLLAKGAKVNIGDKFGTSPLIWACRKGYYEICQALLEHGANTDATGMYSWTALLVATRGNYIELVRLLLDHKPNVNALDKDGGTALTIACKEGYTEIAQALLSAGAYVNIQDRNGDSNLIYAARGGHRTVVESLMKKYADVDIIGKERKNALYWAVEKSHTAVVKLLLTANPDLEHSTKDGDTALLRAVRSKNAEIVQLLIDKRCKVNVADKKGDTCLHIAMRGRSKRIVEILLRNPKNSQMLYRPNRAGETPYYIDLSHQKTILGQIFGARRLNTNEDNENMLGYDLYSSSLADILSEPSLSMPIAVGLYAKWGSGKSFLIRKLKEEMRSFARQWVEPLFNFSPLVFLLILHLAVLAGLIGAAPTQDWRIGVGVGSSVFILLTVFLITVWQGSRRYEFHPWYWLSVNLEKYMASVKLVMQVVFCSPPGHQYRDWKGSVHVRPLKFIFAEGAKPSSTADGESSVVQMLGSLFDRVETEYGMFATRFYRAFRPKSQSSTSPWKYRSLCCIPYVVIYLVTVLCMLTVIVLAAVYGFHEFHPLTSASRDHEDMMSNLKTSVMPTINGIREDDAIDDDDDVSQDSNEENGDDDGDGGDPYHRPYHGWLINPLLYTSVALVAVVLVANLHTIFRMLTSLMFSQRRHLLRSVSKLDTLKAEGYLHTLKEEVTLIVDMVKCLDSFTEQQTRMVVIVDGLDSSEQDKVLSVLDAVHTLFTDTAAPFIILLAIDPHIITKAVEMHVHRVFNESNISGHDYLRNIIHLPFYLQNSGLRKVKQAQQVAERVRGRSNSAWLEVETDSVSMATTSAMGGISHIPANRRLSAESSVSLGPRRNTSKGSRRLLKQSDSVASSIGSNLNRLGGAQDLTKVLLTDDYFSDINPRSMRRLMNVVYITGRLLKAFHIDFNWYHLASWINITEQWPYRASWIILYHEFREDSIDDKVSLKTLYDKIKSLIPNSKDMEPLLEMDKDEKKFEIFLSMHKSSLHVSDIKVFLPFTINLDPFIRKVIKEDQPQFDESAAAFPASNVPQWNFQAPFDLQSSKASTLTKRTGRTGHKLSTGSLPHGSINPLMWGYPGPPHYMQATLQSSDLNLPPPSAQHNLPELNTILAQPLEKHLSSLSLEDLCELLNNIVGLNSSLVPKYQENFKLNNINGKVLAYCDLDDLKKELQMSFGDWELFKMVILNLRERPVEEAVTGALRDDSKRTMAGSKTTGVMTKQLNMEEQMIFGALQTLNEEAYEDAMIQQENTDRLPLAYNASTEDLRRSSGIDVIVGGEEVDVMYLQSSPLLPHRVVAAPPDDDNISVASSNFSPTRSFPSRTPSMRASSAAGSPRTSLRGRRTRTESTDSMKEDLVPFIPGSSFRQRHDSRNYDKGRKISDTSSTKGRFIVEETPVVSTKKEGILSSGKKISSSSTGSATGRPYASVTFADKADSPQIESPNDLCVPESDENETPMSSPRVPLGFNRMTDFKKDRPSSLYLTSPQRSLSTPHGSSNQSPDEHEPLKSLDIALGSLPDLSSLEFPKSVRPNLTQQIHTKSMEKVKKLTKQLKKVITSSASQDAGSASLSRSCSFADSLHGADPEASPLVVTSPITVKDLNNTSVSPGSVDIHQVCAEKYEDEKCDSPTRRRSSNPVSPTKPHDSNDRETHI